MNDKLRNELRSKTLKNIVVAFLVIAIPLFLAVLFAMLPFTAKHSLSIGIFFLFIFGILFIAAIFISNTNSPLIKCPFCKSKLGKTGYELVLDERDHKVIECKNCNKKYRVFQGRLFT